MNILFLESAEAEFLEAIDYYNQQSEGLGFPRCLVTDLSKNSTVPNEQISLRHSLSDEGKYNFNYCGNALE